MNPTKKLVSTAAGIVSMSELLARSDVMHK